MTEATTAYIGLGGNVGDVLSRMRAALSLLHSAEGVAVTAVSPVYKTPPWGVEDQDWFLNACAALQCSFAASDLLELCLQTERSLGRERKERWGPRTIDLDLLLFGDQQILTESLTVPHPRMHERQFVMQPLSDIAPDIKLLGHTIKHWASGFEPEPLEKLDLNKDWWLQGLDPSF